MAYLTTKQALQTSIWIWSKSCPVELIIWWRLYPWCSGLALHMPWHLPGWHSSGWFCYVPVLDVLAPKNCSSSGNKIQFSFWLTPPLTPKFASPTNAGSCGKKCKLYVTYCTHSVAIVCTDGREDGRGSLYTLWRQTWFFLYRPRGLFWMVDSK